MQTGERLNTYELHDGFTQTKPGPDGQTGISYSYDGYFSYWDLESGEEFYRSEEPYQNLVGLDIHPDGRRFVTSGWFGWVPNAIKSWDLETGEQILSVDVPELSVIYFLDISPDGQTLLLATESGIVLRDMETLEPIRNMQGSEGNLDVQFSPDGKTALSSSRERGVVLWDVETGQEIHRFGPGNLGVAISPDGKTALFGPGDGSVEWWDLEPFELLRRFTGHQSLAVWDVDFSPDGNSFISAGEDGLIIHWQLAAPPLDVLLEWITENRYVREFTCAERARYSIEPLCEPES